MTDAPDYPFEGAYAALITALPGWSVDLNDGIDLWNRKGDPENINGFVYTEVGVWVVNIGPRVFERNTREYDGMERADVDAIVVDVVAALQRAVKEAEARAAVVVPHGGMLPPLY